MKVILIVLTFIMTAQLNAKVAVANKIFKAKRNDALSMSYEMFKSKYFFSSAVFAKEHMVNGEQFDQNFETHLEQLILKTGTLTFTGLETKYLYKVKTPSTNFILGLKLFWAKRYQEAFNILKNFPKNHRFSPESYMILGSSASFLNLESEAIANYKICQENAQTLESQAENEKLKRYFTIIKETCLIHIARNSFKGMNSERTDAIYTNIPTTSYRWPYIVLEKAWNSYHQEDYNRVLGLLVTYKSPLLRSYFNPESEYLEALSYYKLCLYNDSLAKIEQYYKVHKPESDALKSILLKHKNSHTYFLKLLFSPIKENESINSYIRTLSTQIRKQVKFNLDLVNYKKLQNEIKYLKKLKKTSFSKFLIEELTGTMTIRTKHLNHYIKREMFEFINKIHRFSYEMFNIKLEIMSSKRTLVYENKELISERSRGDIEHVNRKEQQQFYTFNGEFWADELGDYSFGLKSNCETVKQQRGK